MDPSTALSPAELYELIGILSGVGVTGVVGFLLVRRARRARLRQIEGEDEAPALERARSAAEAAQGAKTEELEETEPEEAEDLPETQRRSSASRREAAPATRPRPAGGQAPPAPPTPRAPEPEPEARRASARARSSPSRSRLRPGSPNRSPRTDRRARAPPAKGRDAAAFAPGLARTRSSGFIARLGQLFAGRKQIDPSIVGEIEKVLLTADIGVRTSQQLLDEIKESLSRKELNDPDAIWAFLRRRSAEMLSLPAPPAGLRRGQAVRAAGDRRERQRQDHDHREAGGEARGRGPEGIAGRGRHVPRRRGGAAGGLGRTHVRDARARQGGSRSLLGDLRRRSSEPPPRASTSPSPTRPDGCTPRPI